jgi:hypothetical protein
MNKEIRQLFDKYIEKYKYMDFNVVDGGGEFNIDYYHDLKDPDKMMHCGAMILAKDINNFEQVKNLLRDCDDKIAEYESGNLTVYG